MKKLILTSVFLLTLLSAVTVPTDFAGTLPDIMAFDSEDDEFIWIEYDNYKWIEYKDMIFVPREGKENELMLDSYYGTESNLIVPEKMNGYTVTGVSDGVFAYKGKQVIVENVTLPDSINYFGSNVFRNSKVVSVNIPKNLRLIPSYTFSDCKNLKTVVFHDDILAVAATAFRNTNITIPENLQNKISYDDYNKIKDSSKSDYGIKDGNFTFLIYTDNDTDSLCCSVDGYTDESAEIILPENFCGVPVKSFDFTESDLSEIKSVTFPETDNEISVSRNSFSESLITELNIKSPCILDANSFADCKNFKTVTFKGDAEIKNRAFNDCTSLTSVEFDSKVNLDYYAFMDCTALENITFDTSQAITGNAFEGCKSLMNINSEPVFDSATGDFKPEYSDFIRNNFYMAEEIGFLNEYAKAQYQKIADEVINPDMSDIEKVKALHDWVCSNTKYADSINPPEYHTDASILLNDSTVCEGYAKACNLLFNYAGIETYYIQSFDHAWNIVKIGGHYFHVDSTWDDGDTISYDFFMKSDSEIKDESSHNSWNAYIPTSLHSFQKNGTPECKYQVGDVNTDGDLNIADAVKMTKYLLNAEIETADNLVLYDLDFDGRIDVFDMILMRQKFLNN